MEYIAYPAAIIMGILLGLIGGGGSILTLPVLVYLMHIPSTEATTYSLFIVGLSAFFGASYYIKNNLISWKTILFFGAPSLSATYFTRAKIVPALPDTMHIFGAGISKDFFIMVLFAILMLGASLSMIRPPKVIQQGDFSESGRYRYVLILIGGLIIGTIVGMLGAGGGFLIIPALVILANLPMKKAIGTSLGLIFINCTIGFGGDIYHGIHPDWELLLKFTAFAIAGMAIGLWLSRYISGSKLKPAFGWFILIVGIFILVKEYYIHHSS
ncbi:MAG TPA: sulfite exporter TauE/SafE family protein [Bacteroidia bacterium]|nr:sulfite exporter TauE/SafE family protein [Bacteroidia bacterium]